MTERRNPAREALQRHVTGAIERGEAEPIVAVELPQPFGPKYQERTESGQSGYECVICGRQTSRKGRENGNTLHARVVGGGCRFATPDEFADPAGDMGYFPVGSECAKQFPAGYLVRM